MLTGITWKQFLEGAALLSLVYYVIICAFYYKQDIKKLIFYKPNKAREGDDDAGSPDDMHESPDPLMPAIYDLMASIKEHLQRAAAQHYAGNEIIFGLQQLIRQYPAIKASRFVPSIYNEIIQLSNELLGQPLSADDITTIWN